MGDSSNPVVDRLRDTEARRLDLLGQIGAKRHSVVISYLTSTRPGVDIIGYEGHTSIHDEDVAIVEEHVRAARHMNAHNIDLIVVTHGGSAAAPWDLVAMVREHLPHGHLRVILPSVAYSAGTAIAIGADEIVMGPNSILGPIDTQFGTKDGVRSASDFQGFMDLLSNQRIRGYRTREKTLDWLTSHTDAAGIGRLYRKWSEDRRQTELLLGSRRSRLSKSQNEKILRFVLYGVANHSQSIRRKEARASGISFITDIEKTGVEPQITELFKIYEDILQLRTPLARRSQSLRMDPRVGDEDDVDASGVPVSDVPIAIVESQHDTNPAYVAYDQRHWNKVPGAASVPAHSLQGEDGVSDLARHLDAGRAKWFSSRSRR